MESENFRPCAVRGEPIYHPGSYNDMMRGRRIGDTYKTVDGVNTMLGVVCRDCMPVVDRATDSFLGDVNGRKKEIRKLTRDPAFISASIQDHARAKIKTILGDLDTPDRWYEMAKDLKQFLQQNFRTNDFVGDESGLPPDRALGCMIDEARTMKFIRGMYEALDNLDVRREEIEMVDAGTGPVPLFGILAALRSQKAKITCLEINKGSAEMARRIIEKLCLQDRVKIINTDATEYQHPELIDLLISETMHVGLTEEPQAQIFNNMVPQVAEDGVIIPESVTVNAGLVAEQEIHPALLRNELLPEARARFAKYSSGPYGVTSLSRHNLLRTVNFELPVDHLPAGDYRLALSSTVRIYGNEVLEVGDSVITAPNIHNTIMGINSEVARVSVTYVPGTPLKKVEVKGLK